MSRTYTSPPLLVTSTTCWCTQRSARGTLISLSGLTSMTMRLPSLNGSMPRLHSLSLTDSQPSTTKSFTTCISSSCLSPLNPITYYHPLRHSPAISDFGSHVSETPTLMLPPTSHSLKWIWKVQFSSSYRTSRISGRHLPSSLPTKQMPPLQQVPFLLRKLLHPLSCMMAPHRSFMSGGPKSGSLPPMPTPLINRRQRLFSHAWKALAQAASLRRPKVGTKDKPPHGDSEGKGRNRTRLA